MSRFYALQSCEFDKGVRKPKFVAQSRPALYNQSNSKLITQGTKQLEISAKLRVFVSNISSLPLKRWYTTYGFFFSYYSSFRTERNIFILFCSAGLLACVQRKFEGVSYLIIHLYILHLINWTIEITSYYKLVFRCFELDLFLHCFDLKDLNPNNHFERLRKDSLFAL